MNENGDVTKPFDTYRIASCNYSIGSGYCAPYTAKTARPGNRFCMCREEFEWNWTKPNQASQAGMITNKTVSGTYSKYSNSKRNRDTSEHRKNYSYTTGINESENGNRQHHEIIIISFSSSLSKLIHWPAFAAAVFLVRFRPICAPVSGFGGLFLFCSVGIGTYVNKHVL